MPVSPVRAAFEEYAGGRTDLVYAAASWHWTDAATRWTRAADLLAPGGVVAVFGGPMKVADPDVQDAVADACGLTVDDEAFRPYDSEQPGVSRWPAYELDGSDLFTDVEDHVLSREVVVPRKEYVGYLSTLSACLQLAPTDRQELLRRIADVVPDQVRLDLAVQLFLARRV
jgi:trans-aconitate methyltransferase